MKKFLSFSSLNYETDLKSLALKSSWSLSFQTPVQTVFNMTLKLIYSKKSFQRRLDPTFFWKAQNISDVTYLSRCRNWSRLSIKSDEISTIGQIIQKQGYFCEPTAKEPDFLRPFKATKLKKSHFLAQHVLRNSPDHVKKGFGRYLNFAK